MRLLRVTPIALLTTLALAGAAAALGASLHAQHSVTTDHGSLSGDHTLSASPDGVSVGTSVTTDHARAKGALDVDAPQLSDVGDLDDPTNLTAPDLHGGASGMGSVESDAASVTGNGMLNLH